MSPRSAALTEQGASTLIEISPHPVLGFGAQEAIESATEPAEATVIGTLRREEGGPGRFALSLAQAHAAGVEVSWTELFKGTAAKAVPLPTYPFQRERFWLSGSGTAGDASSIGQEDPDHPLLSAVIEEPAADGLTFTGRLSLQSHPWLADHAVAGTVLLPGAAFVELALHAGNRAGAGHLEELTLQAPLIVPEQGAVQLQLTLAQTGESAEREISVHSRPEPSSQEDPGEWTCHAEGTLSPQVPEPAQPLSTWPPPGAEPIELDDLYGRLTDIGIGYGPAFQGLTAAWGEGETVYAEVTLAPEQSQQAQSFGIHPALLDAALHGGWLSAGELEPRLPFVWSDVSLHSAGATELRATITPKGTEGISLTLAGSTGTPIAQVGSLATRPLDPAQLKGAKRSPEGLLAISWSEASLKEDTGPQATLWQLPTQSGAKDKAKAARKASALALAKVQEWLADEENETGRLAILTEAALATSAEECPDPAQAAVWGLLRSAQSEHPGRFLLIDTDATEASEQALEQVLGSEGEPQLALREGVALAPRALGAGSGGRRSPLTPAKPS